MNTYTERKTLSAIDTNSKSDDTETYMAKMITPKDSPIKVKFPSPRNSLKGGISSNAAFLPFSTFGPFGPRAKACIIPCKDLSSQVQLEMDALENYHIWSDIGRGSYATVKLATHKSTSQKCAIKIYRKKDLEDPALRKNVMREIKILKKIDHDNIVKFYEEINGKNNLYIVMEYVKGISLNNHVTAKAMKRLQENEACEIFTKIMTALLYCHSKNVVHRDIKLENVLLDLCFNVKLIDFGFATCFANNKKALIFCGSPTYMAPEIIAKHEFFGPPVDIWAAGVLLFVLVTGAFPFNSKSEKRVFEKITAGEFNVPDFVSRSCKDLILAMLNPDVERRVSASQVLSHIWVKTCAGTSAYAAPSSGDNIEVVDCEYT
jgi:serine/threonine protein kinase